MCRVWSMRGGQGGREGKIRGGVFEGEGLPAGDAVRAVVAGVDDELTLHWGAEAEGDEGGADGELHLC